VDVWRAGRRCCTWRIARRRCAARRSRWTRSARIALYGASVGEGPPIGKPVVALRARVVSVRSVQRGESVSYNASWTAPRDTTVATLAIGYADGYAARSG